MSKDLLLEIGTEEIPAHYMPSILGQVKDLAEKSFGEANIAYESVRTLGTPRRIALLMKGVAEKQADVSAKHKARRSPLPMTRRQADQGCHGLCPRSEDCRRRLDC